MREDEGRMTDGERQWAALLMQSVEEVRALIVAENTVDRNAMLHLLNRAESLVRHLKKREPTAEGGA